ncbi:fatty acid synthase [Rhipicephalus sanguineus]|uniref:fatty acid synthase n=1 Tax=Rhipicephalus sanguineus TaxID=34632 RepID=UPI0020C5A95E|nr:fatty acid synthase [Rhipicephalus sanguineus]
MTDEKKLSYLMRGVKEQLFAGLLRNPPSTVADFIKEATAIERALHQRCRQYDRMSSSAPISAVSMTFENQSALRDLIREIVREELQKLRTPVVETPIASVVEVVRDEIRQAFSAADPDAEQRPMSYAAAVRRPPLAKPSPPTYRQPPVAPWSPPQDETLRRPPVLPYRQPSTTAPWAAPQDEMFRRPQIRKTDAWRTGTMEDDDIVITGVSARFPQADNLVEFKEKLYGNVDLVTDDEARWPRGLLGLPGRMGTIRDLSRFDAHFFGVNPKQAHLMDPQMRLLLETSYEAIVDAGYEPATMRGRKVGVFIGCGACDSDEVFSLNTDRIDGYGLAGSNRAMLSNRISYSLDFHGPSITIDTACSSTFSALNHAVSAMRSGQCEAAIVGGSMVALNPVTSLSFTRFGMLSPDGQCRPFDSDGNGYTRSETVGAFFIQNIAKARRIYARIVGVRANSDGYKKEGISVPSTKLQEELIREVYSEAKVDPQRVLYVEAHGTGTKVGDPLELAAIRSVFCGSQRDKPLKIGSVKSNMGHAEAASGICSLAKVILAMETGTIAGNLHFRVPNPRIPSLLDGTLEVVDKPTAFQGGMIGVNSFGFGGANAHVILQAKLEPDVNDIRREKPELPRLVLLAGRSRDSLMRTMDSVEAEGPYPDSGYALLNLVGQPDVSQFPLRGYLLVPVDGSGENVLKEVDEAPSKKRPLWLVFTGMGCQWRGMGRQMMCFDVFARSIQRSRELLRQFGIDLINLVTAEKEAETMAGLFASIVALQVALVDAVFATGVRPDGVVGHSMGEIGCAYADGCFTAEQAVLCAYWRGRCVDLGNLPRGAMAAVGLTWEEAAKRCPEGVEPACHNAEDSVTVSGPADSVYKFVEELKAQNVFAKMVTSANVAFHSKYVHSTKPSLLEALKKVVKEVKPRSKRWLSSSLPPDRWHEPLAQVCSPEYQVNNFVSPVLFFEALQHVPKDAILVEVAPHCLLQGVLRRAMGSEASSLGLMKREVDNHAYFLNTLGQLHLLGVKLDLSPLYPPVTLPVPRGTPSIGHLVSWDHSETWTVAKWDDFAPFAQLSEEVVEVEVGDHVRHAYLEGHRIHGRLVYPAAGYIVMAWKSFAKRCGKSFDKVPVVIENLTFHRAVILQKSGTTKFLVNIMRASGEFEISEAGTLASSGHIRIANKNEHVVDVQAHSAQATGIAYDLDKDDIYKEFRLRGYEYEGDFQGILKASMQEPYGELEWHGNWVTFIDTMLQMSILHNAKRTCRLPVKIQSCRIDPNMHVGVAEKARNGVMDVAYDPFCNICRSGGITLQGLKGSVASQRVENQAPLLNAYTFVPYIDNEAAREQREASIREYVDDCNLVAQGIISSRSSNSNLTGHASKRDSHFGQGLQRYLTDSTKNHGLLRILTTIEEEVRTSTMPVDLIMQSSVAKYTRELEGDIIMSTLLEEDPLRYLLDVVVENTSVKEIHVLELFTREGQYPLVHHLSSFFHISHALLNVGYTVAYPSSGIATPKEVPEAVKVIPWDPQSQSNTVLPEADLIVSCLPTWGFYRLEALAANLSEQCKKQEFLLLAARTATTQAELLLSSHGKVSLTAHVAEDMVSLFNQHGFCLVGLKSNNFATLLLLRKKSLAEVANVETIKVSSAKHEWIRALSTKAVEFECKPGGHNLWLLAEDRCVSGIVGLTNCVRLETGGKHIRCILDTTLGDPHGSDFNLDNAADIPTSLLEKDLVMNVYRDSQWGSFRYSDTVLRQAQRRTSREFAYLDIQVRGDLSSLKWYVSPLGYTSTDGTLCDVYYAAVNFRDVVLATGRLSPDALPGFVESSDGLLGMEFSGRDPQGRRVMGLVSARGIATVVDVNPAFLWEVPETWSLKEAATVPVAYATAYYTLLVRGNVQAGESLLVHSGSGGVGQAIISIALSMGCTVFTTVGSEKKRQFLMRRYPQLEHRNVANSRDLSFEEHVLRETKGRGVDVVINSLAEEKLQASVRCLATNGRFLEIGKFDLSNDSPLGMSAFLKGVTFHGILLELLLRDDSGWRRVAELVRTGIALGVVQPLDVILYPSDEAEAAFRFMASGKHVGKIVLQTRPEEDQQLQPSPLCVDVTARTWFYAHKSYVIIGGLGGFGLELAEWMVKRGCRKLLLTTRSGVRMGYQRLCLHRWKKAGVNVIVSKEDASTEGGARNIIQKAVAMGPVGGIFNLAVVLHDGLLEGQTAEAFEAVFKIKICGTQNMDELSRLYCPELDHFVVFSSLASGNGNVGQTNYGYANSAMERICERRSAHGLPGLAIQWGAIGDVGVFYEMMGGDAIVAGTVPQRISSCMSVMDTLLNQSHPVVCSCVKADTSCEATANEKHDIVDSVLRIIGVKNSSHLNTDVAFGEIGMDSLMAVEVRQTIERECKITVSMQEVRRLNINQLRQISQDIGAKKNK